MAFWRRSTAMSRPPSARPRATEPNETSKPSSTSSPVTCSLIHPFEAATSHFAERELDSEGRSVSGPMYHVADGPLSFTYSENLAEIENRVRDWLDMAINVALEHFRKEL